MSGANRPFRVTESILDVAADLKDTDGEVHAYAISKRTGRPTTRVHGALERLVDAGWAEYRWEDQNPKPGKPRRRLFRLTARGKAGVAELLNERRGGAAGLVVLESSLCAYLGGWR
jgi:DNA-binding PadR family transcriptional regulator